MSDKFEACHAITAKWEGGWSDHPADPGGKTMFGITQATLSAYLGRPASDREIRNLDRATALAIYRERYWKRVAGDELPAGVDLCVYDFGVNSGPDRAVKSLQAALGVKADGWVGNLTLKALAEQADIARVIADLCDRREIFLRGLPTFSRFGKGWLNRLADIRNRAMRMSRGAPQTPPVIAPAEGTAKAVPAPPAEKTVSTEQKVGGAAAGAVVVTTTLGPVAGFWRDNKDVLSDPIFLAVAGVLAAVVIFMLLRRPKTVEEQA
ncbi:glycoside hydrolase family 108 protein [Bosea sp. (in: a-proteobacteria)]|uniref:glycoside hydrolase family 108 protein n=1 Tax=Bosea sp. (in: a-proteobacteria) TaxID=1871050 RepID=UPI003B3AB6BF